MDLLLATRNRHKTREFAELLGKDVLLRDLSSEPNAPNIIETGSSFEENAAVKALAVSRTFPVEMVIADDSGLEVDALGGAPGIFSARYAGKSASDQQNIAKLLCELRSSSVEPPRSDGNSCWPARFRCAIAAAKGGVLLATLAGELAGNVIELPRGTNGFGYDPVFVPEGCSQTFAELPSEVKNQISHRARATRKLGNFLRAYY
jgi:XTP/dITP diphosphohydrolase